jgi:hypothetical protein
MGCSLVRAQMVQRPKREFLARSSRSSRRHRRQMGNFIKFVSNYLINIKVNFILGKTKWQRIWLFGSLQTRKNCQK